MKILGVPVQAPLKSSSSTKQELLLNEMLQKQSTNTSIMLKIVFFSPILIGKLIKKIKFVMKRHLGFMEVFYRVHMKDNTWRDFILLLSADVQWRL